MNSLVVQTLLTGADAVACARWFDAVTEALAKVAQTRELQWRVALGDAAESRVLDVESAQRFSEVALAAGGECTMHLIELGGDPLELHRRLAAEADEAAVLILDYDALPLASTVSRLLDSLADGVAVRSREVPLERQEGASPACELMTLEQLLESRGSVIDAAECPESVVFVDRRIGGDRGEGVESQAGGGSLLEEASMSVPSARDEVARKLGHPDGELMTIVMRTQGKRLEALRDALVCLAGQSDSRFEVLLVVHDRDASVIHEVLDDQPTWLRQRTTVLAAHGGTRARPLNVGLAAAHGSVVSFFDDDDLAFGHWVETVLNGTVRFPRRLLRTTVGVQRVTTAPWRGEVEGHSTQSAVELPYPEHFNLADHLRVNMTPFMALAFPRGFFELYGVADEELDVCEDWDLLLRAALSLGVVDIAAVTAIYRRWTSGNDSYTEHDPEVWSRDMDRVRAKCDAVPLILAPGSASELAALSLLRATPPVVSPFERDAMWWLAAPFRAAYRLVRRRPLVTR